MILINFFTKEDFEIRKKNILNKDFVCVGINSFGDINCLL